MPRTLLFSLALFAALFAVLGLVDWLTGLSKISDWRVVIHDIILMTGSMGILAQLTKDRARTVASDRESAQG